MKFFIHSIDVSELVGVRQDGNAVCLVFGKAGRKSNCPGPQNGGRRHWSQRAKIEGVDPTAEQPIDDVE